MKTSRLICLLLMMFAIHVSFAQRRIYVELAGNARWKAVVDGKTYYGETKPTGDSRNPSWVSDPPLPDLESSSRIMVCYNKEWYMDHDYGNEVMTQWLHLRVVSRKFDSDLNEALRHPRNDPAYATHVQLLKMKAQDSEVVIYKDSLNDFCHPSWYYPDSTKVYSTKSFNKAMEWPTKKAAPRKTK